MPKQLWTAESEEALIVAWHGIMQSSRGQMLTKAEKYETVKEKMNVESKKPNWGVEFSTDQIHIKVDALTKKAKKIYSKIGAASRTGSAVDDRADLQVHLSPSKPKP